MKPPLILATAAVGKGRYCDNTLTLRGAVRIDALMS
jgi:hypothetical protein